MTAIATWARGTGEETTGELLKAIEQCEQLPVLDATVQRVLKAANDEESSVGTLVAAIEADPSFAANMLRFANSAYYSRPIRVTTVRQAVTMVGRVAIRRMALETATFRFFERAPGNGRAWRGQMHVHSIGVATLAAAIAERAGIDGDVPHLAGLLHDCGKLVMPLAFSEDTMDEIAASSPAGVARAAVERDRLGVDHAVAGALFAAYNGADEAVVQAIAAHHGGRLGVSVPSKEAACVQVADALAHMLGGSPPDEPLLDAGLAKLSLPISVLDELAEMGSVGGEGGEPGQIADRLQELEKLSQTDDLTGVANRRHWMATVRETLESGTPGSIVAIDVDRFGEINTHFGHSGGDAALVVISDILRRHGTAGRLGGDEFVLWVPGDTEAGEDASLGVLAGMDDVRSSGEPLARRLSISMGICSTEVLGQDIYTLLQRADEALYAAKSAGRARAHRATERGLMPLLPKGAPTVAAPATPDPEQNGNGAGPDAS
jgi:diguanylate cyclase (GGDEF)-like protein/putative nucleotidyltransferase with HDIG domain